MQVLKDAGSASIYGSRASNGVVIITTKRETGKVKVSYDMFYGTQTVQKGNVYDILSPQGMADLKFLALENSGATINDAQYGAGATPVLPDYIVPAGAKEGEVDLSKYYVNPYYTDKPDMDSFYRIVKANKQGTDWFSTKYSRMRPSKAITSRLTAAVLRVITCFPSPISTRKET